MQRLPPGWFDPQQRVPRRNERVRIRRASGVEHLATFTVQHTEDWPAGASWALDLSDAALPFYEVVAWRAYDPARDAAVPPPPVSAVRPLPVPALGVELVQEVALTRLALDALPDGDGALDWRPSETMPSLGALAADVAALVGRMVTILERDYFDAATEVAEPAPPSKEAVLTTFAWHAQRVLDLVPTTTADRLRAPWTLYRNDQATFTRPRGDVLRRLAVSPLVHTRGQLVLLLHRYGVAVTPFYAPWALPVVIPPLPPGEEGAGEQAAS